MRFPGYGGFAQYDYEFGGQLYRYNKESHNSGINSSFRLQTERFFLLDSFARGSSFAPECEFTGGYRGRLPLHFGAPLNNGAGGQYIQPWRPRSTLTDSQGLTPDPTKGDGELGEWQQVSGEWMVVPRSDASDEFTSDADTGYLTTSDPGALIVSHREPFCTRDLSPFLADTIEEFVGKVKDNSNYETPEETGVRIPSECLLEFSFKNTDGATPRVVCNYRDEEHYTFVEYKIVRTELSPTGDREEYEALLASDSAGYVRVVDTQAGELFRSSLLITEDESFKGGWLSGILYLHRMQDESNAWRMGITGGLTLGGSPEQQYFLYQFYILRGNFDASAEFHGWRVGFGTGDDATASQFGYVAGWNSGNHGYHTPVVWDFTPDFSAGITNDFAQQSWIRPKIKETRTAVSLLIESRQLPKRWKLAMRYTTDWNWGPATNQGNIGPALDEIPPRDLFWGRALQGEYESSEARPSGNGNFIWSFDITISGLSDSSHELIYEIFGINPTPFPGWSNITGGHWLRYAAFGYWQVSAIRIRADVVMGSILDGGVFGAKPAFVLITEYFPGDDMGGLKLTTPGFPSYWNMLTFAPSELSNIPWPTGETFEEIEHAHGVPSSDLVRVSEWTPEQIGELYPAGPSFWWCGIDRVTLEPIYD